MSRPIVIIMTLLAAFGSWLFFRDFPLEDLRRLPGGAGHASIQGSSYPVAGTPTKRPGETIHVATFNVQVFGRTKAGKVQVVETLANIMRHFDVVAVQEIRSEDQDVLPRFVDHINAGGRSYDYVIGPRVGRSGTTEQFAYIFDRDTVEMDRYQLYTIRDPDDLLNWEPLVGWFRAVGPRKKDAYTFTLINVHIDSENKERELSVLDDVVREVRNDGRGEDDVIILGDFDEDARRLGTLTQTGGASWATTGVPTNTQGTEQLDNVVFHPQATTEFTGRGGVFDFMRQFNLTLDEALEISDHLPVWAEFTVYEGGVPGRVASGPTGIKVGR